MGLEKETELIGSDLIHTCVIIVHTVEYTNTDVWWEQLKMCWHTQKTLFIKTVCKRHIISCTLTVFKLLYSACINFSTVSALDQKAPHGVQKNCLFFIFTLVSKLTLITLNKILCEKFSLFEKKLVPKPTFIPSA